MNPTLGLSFLVLLGSVDLGAAKGLTFTNASEIRRLSREAADSGYVVNLTGVVTYSDPSWNLLFVRDGSAGIFVNLAGLSYPTNAELVEIAGRTAAGSFLPVVMANTWRHLGAGELPEPRRIHQPDRFASEIDSEWSELVGVVRKVELNADRDHVQIDLSDGNWRARVFLPAPEGRYPVEFEHLVDARIRAVGVIGVDYADPPESISLKAFIPGPGFLQVLDKPTADPFQLPFVSLSQLRASLGTNTPVHRIHIQGLATYQNRDELFVQENNSAVRVLFPKSTVIKPGDALEAVGFVVPGLFAPTMEDANIRPLAAHLKAEPIPVAPATVLWGNYDARLVQLTGTVQNKEVLGNNLVLTLLQDEIVFAALLDAQAVADPRLQLEPGERVRVTGVCAVQGTGRAIPQSFKVLLRSPTDVVPVPTIFEFSTRQVLLGIAGGAAGWGLVLLWGVILRRKVSEQTKELAGSLSLLNATIESTGEGILVVNPAGKLTSCNTNLARMWQLPAQVIAAGEERKFLEFAAAQLKDGEGFLNQVRALNAKPEAESFDTLEFKDGRIFERLSRPQRLDNKFVGRVWCFRDITARKAAEAQLTAVHHQLLETSRLVGMAEVASAVLHNVGNVLNSVNVSATLVTDRLRRTRVQHLDQAAHLLQTRMEDLEVFLAQDPKGQKLRGYLKDLSAALVRENDELRAEVESLRKNVEHIKTIVAMQQNYAQVSGNLEHLDPRELMESAFQINCAAYERQQIRVLRNYQTVPTVLVDRHKVLQILVNLLTNARQALEQIPGLDRCVTLGLACQGPNSVCLTVRDNGVGIAPENLSRIFTQGYTTRKDGHGFGLHSGANAAREMNGSLSVSSDGPTKGAVFTLELPASKPPQP